MCRVDVVTDSNPSTSMTTTSSTGTRISISDAFDGGNIELGASHDNNKIINVNGDNATQAQVHLRIRPDPYTELEKMHHYQYFCFRATISGMVTENNNNNNDTTKSPASLNVTYVIDNADQVSYPVAWPGSTICYTENIMDTNSWRRALDTVFTDGKLTWSFEHTKNGSIYFSYFPPYTYAQHLDLIAKCTKYARNVESLGQSHEGRDIECITVGTGDSVCWIIHRQHPGETQAEYFAEGLLNRLLGLETHGEVDGLVLEVLRKYRFYIVPCMCPDGAVRGHLRTNSVGANLNREWATIPGSSYEAPTLERSPEVYYTLQKMMETGCDAFVDVHGDEELPYNFLVSGEDVGNWGPRLASLHGVFTEGYVRANPDMQKEFGYGPVPREKQDTFLNAAMSEVARRFDCLAVTLEMPYKDCQTNPDPERGWTPHRSRLLGASLVDALVRVHPYLRMQGEFWKDLLKDDDYMSSRMPEPI